MYIYWLNDYNFRSFNWNSVLTFCYFLHSNFTTRSTQSLRLALFAFAFTSFAFRIVYFDATRVRCSFTEIKRWKTTTLDAFYVHFGVFLCAIRLHRLFVFEIIGHHRQPECMLLNECDVRRALQTLYRCVYWVGI